MEDQEKQFIKGFNNGYLLAKNDPELAAMLTKIENDHSEYFQGLVHGKEEYELDKNHQQVKDNDNPTFKSKEDIEKER